MWYPNNVIELEDKLHSEDDCLNYLFSLRWPKGYCCLKCKSKSYWKKTRGRIHCRDCNYEASVLVGTIFEGSHTKLRIWFRAIWWIISEKQGTSALALQKTLGLGSYKTAWLMLHKIREAMVTQDRKKLSGKVEFDEMYLGGKSYTANRKNPENKQILTIGVEINGKGCGRIRIEQIERINTETVVQSVCRLVEPGSLVITDAFGGYNHIKEYNYQHKSYNQSKETKKDYSDDSRLPRVHMVISLLKKWYMGTLQGRISKKHMTAYLEEFVFRFNRRNSKARGLLFLRLLENGILITPKTYNELKK